ncbi:hypothetical protein HKX48_002322 [Thoreauomyces humboldtii]|nr:hypothetical protein HKX48_002322 [Thoreauomyces humboldtii]
MSRDDLLTWFTHRLSRPPDATDVYTVARDFYQLGAHSRALACLTLYVTLPAAATPGRHLLAHCHLAIGDGERALKEFKKCVKEGYHEDWQLVVELTIEGEERRRKERGRGEDGVGVGDWPRREESVWQ